MWLGAEAVKMYKLKITTLTFNTSYSVKSRQKFSQKIHTTYSTSYKLKITIKIHTTFRFDLPPFSRASEFLTHPHPPVRIYKS